jgi:hypothetical protein
MFLPEDISQGKLYSLSLQKKQRYCRREPPSRQLRLEKQNKKMKMDLEVSLNELLFDFISYILL